MKSIRSLAAFVIAGFMAAAGWADCAAPKVRNALQLAFETRSFADAADLFPTEQNDAGVVLYRGKAQAERFRYPSAYADFARAYALAPDFAEITYQLGRAELRGFSGSADVERGLSLLDMAAAQGCDEASFVASLHRLQRTRGRDRDALESLKRLSVAGHRESALLLGRIFQQGAGVPADASAAYAHYRRAADAGDPLAQYEVGQALLLGLGVDKDPDAARTWLDSARMQGEPRAHWREGLELMKAEQARAAHYEYWQSAVGGFMSGQINLAVGLLLGVGVRQDFREAAYWLHRASDAPLAQMYLGDLYVQGRGVDSDLARAFEWYERAAGVMPAARAIVAGMLAQGIGVDKDTERAEEIESSLGTETDPGTLAALADVYSTHPLVQIRRPQQALALAQRAYEGVSSSANADTLAAAYAAMGQFDEAIPYARIALTNGTSLLNRPGVQARLDAFQRGEAWSGIFALQPAKPAPPVTRQKKAVFVGEFVGLFERASSSPPGIDLDQPGVFGITVLVESTTEGRLPQRLNEILNLYVHSPTHFFSHLASRPATLTLPVGRFQFTLFEMESGSWHHELEFQPIAGKPVSASR